MATITEDYVSFETAKLLKEKGFDECCQYQYINCSSGHPYLTDIQDDAGNYYRNSEIENDEFCAPTLQMSMKWLREVHNISVEPLVDFGGGEEYWWTADVGYIKKDGLVTELCGYDSYEDAVEAAIKYCLENLI